MSERDDELIGLLRTELSHRAAVAPRDGFERRALAAVHTSAPRRRLTLQRLAVPAVALATATVLAGAIGIGVWTHRASAPAPAHHPTPTPAGRALLVLESDVTPTEHDFSLTDGSGHVVRTATAQAGAVFNSLETRAVRVQGVKQDWVLHRDGTVTAVHPAAKAELDRGGPAVVMVDDHTALTVTSNDSGFVQLVEVNVVSGATTVLLSGQIPPGADTPGSYVLGMMGISSDWRTVYVLVHDMVVNGKLVSDSVVDDVDLVTHRLVRSRVLPNDDSTAVMSRDGRLVAWQDAHVDSRRNIEYFETHVTDLVTGHTVDIPSATMGVFQPRAKSFSPDGSRLYVGGNDNEGTPEGVYAIALVSTQDGHLLDRLQSPSMFNDELTAVGWLDDDHFAYTSIHSDHASYFDTTAGIGHVIDLASRSGAVAIGSARGALVAIIE